MAIPWAGIGSAVSAIGGLFKKKPKAQAQGVDYAKLVRDAQAAGFNPLTALAYGGSQAYQRTFGPGLSRMEDVGQVIQNFAQQQFDRQMQEDRLALDRGYFDQAERADARDAERLGLERRRVEAQLAGAVFGPVFGPSARAARTGTNGNHSYYDDQAAAYGPLVAPAAGLGRAIRDTVSDMWTKWHSTGSARLPVLDAPIIPKLPSQYEPRPVSKDAALERRQRRDSFGSLQPFNY